MGVDSHRKDYLQRLRGLLTERGWEAHGPGLLRRGPTALVLEAPAWEQAEEALGQLRQVVALVCEGDPGQPQDWPGTILRAWVDLALRQVVLDSEDSFCRDPDLKTLAEIFREALAPPSSLTLARLHVRSLRVAGWALATGLGALAGILSYYRGEGFLDRCSPQLYNLAQATVLLLVVAQSLRAGGCALFSRLAPLDSPHRRADRWAYQSWGPLMLENLLYGLYLTILAAFLLRYQAKLGYLLVPADGWRILAELYLSGLLLTVASAYAALRDWGPLPLLLWAVLSPILGPAWSSLGLSLAFWGMARGVGLPPLPRRPGQDQWAAALCVCLFTLPLYLMAVNSLLLGPEGWTSLYTVEYVLAVGLALYFEYPLGYRAKRVHVSWLEWLIVVVILLVLAAILVPNLRRGGCGSPATACKSNLKNIGTAMEMYATDNAGRYPTSPSQLTPNYLKTIPTCPSVGSTTYVFSMASGPDNYTVVCAGVHHQNAGILAPNFPQYTSLEGLRDRPR